MSIESNNSTIILVREKSVSQEDARTDGLPLSFGLIFGLGMDVFFVVLLFFFLLFFTSPLEGGGGEESAAAVDE